MRVSARDLLHSDSLAITLLGMSGVGKTYISDLLAADGWFHYSGDYRIGKHYLNQPIVEYIKSEAGKVPLLAELLEAGSIDIVNQIRVDHLKPIATFLGMLGNPELGGLPLDEFKRRQQLHREAEIRAMLDVPEFISRSRQRGFSHFVNDAGGSLCELDDEAMLNTLAQHTIIVYFRTSQQDEELLIERAMAEPKPMFYRAEFLQEVLPHYMQERNLDYVALIDPKDFFRWVFPKLFHSRLPRYQRIADQYGYTLQASDLREVKTAKDFLGLLSTAVEAQVGAADSK